MSNRPSVSVVVPYLGDAGEAARVLGRLSELDLTPGDEVILADNSAGGEVPEPGPGPVRVVRAPGEQSPFHARNVGAEAARNEWLVFLDADCRPRAGLISAYFATPVAARCAVLAGAVRPDAGQPGIIPAYARSRRMLSEEHHLESRPGWPHPAGITGNLAVRREAWSAAGGFHEGLRAGGDIELCWRLQAQGWTLQAVPAATVAHTHVESLRRLLRQASGHGAGMTWVNRRYPGSFPRPQLARALARSAAGTLLWPLVGRPRRGLFKLIDGAWTAAYAHGYLMASNRARRRGPPAARGDGGTAFLAERFPRPERGEPDPPLEENAWVEALSRPERPDLAALRRARVVYAEDDPPAARLAALLWLFVRHPVRAARAPTGRGAGGLAALAPPARRCARAGRVAILPGETAADVRRLDRLVGPQSASTRWRSDPRAEA